MMKSRFCQLAQLMQCAFLLCVLRIDLKLLLNNTEIYNDES